MFFGSARQAFLAFLSRLTPQVLFLTLAIIFGSKLDLTKIMWTFQGLKNALPFALCTVMFFGAVIASTTLFIEETVTSVAKYDRYAIRINRLPISGLRRLALVLCGVWKYNKPMLFQAAFVLVVMEVGFLATVVIAVQGAMASPLLGAHS